MHIYLKVDPTGACENKPCEFPFVDLLTAPGKNLAPALPAMSSDGSVVQFGACQLSGTSWFVNVTVPNPQAGMTFAMYARATLNDGSVVTSRVYAVVTGSTANTTTTTTAAPSGLTGTFGG